MIWFRSLKCSWPSSNRSVINKCFNIPNLLKTNYLPLIIIELIDSPALNRNRLKIPVDMRWRSGRCRFVSIIAGFGHHIAHLLLRFGEILTVRAACLSDDAQTAAAADSQRRCWCFIETETLTQKHPVARAAHRFQPCQFLQLPAFNSSWNWSMILIVDGRISCQIRVLNNVR